MDYIDNLIHKHEKSIKLLQNIQRCSNFISRHVTELEMNVDPDFVIGRIRILQKMRQKMIRYYQSLN